MRQDQFERLQELTEKLTDVFLDEATPDKWPGAGVEPTSWDQQTRGDRYWMKKNAAATLTVIMKTNSLVGVIQNRSAGGGAGGVPDPEQEKDDDGLDAEMRAAEKEASRLMKELQSRSTPNTVSKKVNGKSKQAAS